MMIKITCNLKNLSKKIETVADKLKETHQTRNLTK